MKIVEAMEKLDNVKHKMFDKLAKKGFSTLFSKSLCLADHPLILCSYFDIEFFIDACSIIEMNDEQLLEYLRTQMILGLSKALEVLKEK